MIIICEAKATEAQIQVLQQKIHEAGLVAHRSDGVEHTILGVVGDRNRLDIGSSVLDARRPRCSPCFHAVQAGEP